MKDKKRIIYFAVVLIILVGMNFVPVSGALTAAGRNTIGIILVMLISFITGALPLGIVAILIMMLLFLTGAAESFSMAISGFATGPVLFMFCANAMSKAVSDSPLSNRIVYAMLKLFGKSIRTILLALMAVTAIVSAFISNVPTCAMFVTIALSLLKLYDSEEDRKITGKAFMIATSVAAMVGGIMTPVGSSPNLVAIEVLKSMTGYQITFVEWCCYGVPIACLLIPLAWFIITKVYVPVNLTREQLEIFIESNRVEHGPDKKEVKLTVILLAMIVLWFASSWIKAIDLYVVAVVGTMVMFLPGIGVLDWDGFCAENNWDAFFVVPMVISLGNVITANNLSQILVDTIFSGSLSLPLPALIFGMSLFMFVMLIFLPNGGAAITVMAAPMISLALSAGYNPVIFVTALCFCATNCYFLPVEAVPLIAYQTGYFKMSEMPKVTWMVLLALAALLALWSPFISSVLA